MPAAEPTPANFMTAPGFQEFMGHPATSQAAGGVQTPTAHAPRHAAAVYQTPGTLPGDGAQPITGVAPEPRPAPSRPPYSAPPPPRAAPVRPYFSTIPESSYHPPAIQGSSGGYSGPQGSSNSYFSAIPESSYRPPAIQASSNGSTGYQGQTSGQKVTAPRGYFECRDLVQQGQQPMFTAPAVWLPRGGGQTGRGYPRGRGQEGGGQPSTVQSGCYTSFQLYPPIVQIPQPPPQPLSPIDLLSRGTNMALDYLRESNVDLENMVEKLGMPKTKVFLMHERLEIEFKEQSSELLSALSNTPQIYKGFKTR
ncbi:PREDICTED: uncharacterized protein LOC109211336 [Nicotiana attenuata]|uniref:uncharacterized protein LOC109211336 n=1 Tax=Nicotiana attenuata TaxID=49451 RepID=UPI0009057276|nr:PREDICTED: uncharacterized protein LOC109211336 [Nicotiana attenuata]